jgi:trk system potassium uptake protein TrkH
MLFGGLGFITWHELFTYFTHQGPKNRSVLSLHTKIILITTAAIIATTITTFWFLERSNTLIDLGWFDAATNTIFNGISMRGTGFTTVSPHEVSLATILIIMIASFIGASPGSTGSGIKTTTLALFLATIRAAVNERSSVEIRGRRIAKDQIHKSLAVVALSVSWILLVTFILLITEPTWEFIDVLFEVMSAFATLGLSLGITPLLSVTGKLLILTTMIIGRIGLLTIVLALRKPHDTADFSYPEERVMLG